MTICPVTTIIPTFNRAYCLRRALDSVVRQTCICQEVLVVDDGSTDGTDLLLAEYADKYQNLIRVLHTENRGVAAARNLGIRSARCHLLAFLDSDDHWHKRKLETQCNALAEYPDFSVSHTKEIWYRRGKHLNQKKKHIPRHGDIFAHCVQLCAVGMSTVMIRKEVFEAVGLFDETMQCCEDYDLWLRVSDIYNFLLIDQALTIKEGGREDQLSRIHRVGMDEKRIRSLLKFLKKTDPEAPHYALAKKELEKKINIFAKGCIKHRKADLAEKYLRLLETFK